MRAIWRFWLILAITFSLSGCYITQNGHICSVTMPRAFCDHEVYEALLHPKPLVADWLRSETSDETRLKDWVNCGGTSDGGYGFPALPNGMKRTIEQNQEESRLTYYKIQRCMMRKQYVYTDQCETSISEKFPACRARRGEPWE